MGRGRGLREAIMFFYMLQFLKILVSYLTIQRFFLFSSTPCRNRTVADGIGSCVGMLSMIVLFSNYTEVL